MSYSTKLTIVQTSLGTYVIPGTIPVGNGLRIRFTTTDGTGAILAESQQINVLSATGSLAPSAATATQTGSSSTNSASGTAAATHASGADAFLGHGSGALGAGMVVAVAIAVGLMA